VQHPVSRRDVNDSRFIDLSVWLVSGGPAGCPRAVTACSGCVTTSFRARSHPVSWGNQADESVRVAPPQAPHRGSWGQASNLTVCERCWVTGLWPAGGGVPRFVGEETRRWTAADGEQRCDREDVVSATMRDPDGRRSVVGAFSGNGGREQPFGVRVGLRIRCAHRVRVHESRAGCEVCERHGYSADVEGATAAVMRYGCQRGEIFEGCEWRCRERHANGQGFGSGRVCPKRSESCPVLGRNKPRTIGWLKPSGW
jgi:hypothetical protein